MPINGHPLKDPNSDTLSPLPPSLSNGLIPVAVLGFLSFIVATPLFFALVYRMAVWRSKKRPSNQFVFLIANLLFADIQQSLAFLLNAEWVARGAIQVGTTSCWAQGCKFTTFVGMSKACLQS
jgi:hypothetical protein